MSSCLHQAARSTPIGLAKTRKLSRFGRVLFFRWIEIWHRSESAY